MFTVQQGYMLSSVRYVQLTSEWVTFAASFSSVQTWPGFAAYSNELT